MNQLWQACIPRIRAGSIDGDDGEMFLSWDELSERCLRLVKGYRVFILYYHSS